MTPRTPKVGPNEAALVLALLDAGEAHAPGSGCAWVRGYCSAIAAQAIAFDPRREPDPSQLFTRNEPGLEDVLRERRHDTTPTVGIPLGRMTPPPAPKPRRP
jgi:hypothetical protein